jgi:hypothetical protein
MRLLLALALAGSLLIHLAVLFGTNIELLGGEPEPEPLQAVLRPPPAAAAKVPRPAKKAGPPGRLARPPLPGTPLPGALLPETSMPPAMAPEPETPVPTLAAAEPKEEKPAAVPVKPLLPASGVIRFSIYKESLGMPVGRAEHSWEFTSDGHYRLNNVTETSGLVALFKPVRVRVESRGSLVAGGLQPDSYRSWKNGEDNRDGVDFDWASGQLHLLRNDSWQPVVAGMQDLLSLTYQLAYLETPAAGSSIALATVRKVERYALEALGEEDVVTPAGTFHTLHLRARADTTTEIWIALDLHRLPVKIRYTDKKGDSFLQVATEIGSLARPAQP